MAEKKLGMDKDWTEAARRCRLSAADVRMAKELGFKPRSLLKNVPSRNSYGRRRSLSGSASYTPDANAVPSSDADVGKRQTRQVPSAAPTMRADF